MSVTELNLACCAVEAAEGDGQRDGVGNAGEGEGGVAGLVNRRAPHTAQAARVEVVAERAGGHDKAGDDVLVGVHRQLQRVGVAGDVARPTGKDRVGAGPSRQGHLRAPGVVVLVGRDLDDARAVADRARCQRHRAQGRKRRRDIVLRGDGDGRRR